MEHHLHARMSVASTILDNIKRVTVDDSALSNLVSMLKELFRVDDAEEFEHIPNAELEPAFHNVTATFYMMPKIQKRLVRKQLYPSRRPFVLVFLTLIAAINRWFATVIFP